MTGADSDVTKSIYDKLLAALGDSWQSIGELRLAIGGGDTFKIAQALDKLWRAGRIDREAREMILGVRRKSGGAQLRVLRYRRRHGQGSR